MPPKEQKQQNPINSEFLARWNPLVPLLRKHALRLMKNDSDKANDLIADTRARVFKNADKYTKDENFGGWVYTIMRNLFINYYNKQKRMLGGEDAETVIMNTVDESQDLERQMFAKEVFDMIEELEPKHRQVIKMFFVDGLSFKEISEILNIPEGTVKSRYDRALIKLRSLTL